MAQEDQDYQRRPDEPRYMPSQAEGDADPNETPVEHLRTPGQAEGKKEDVEEALQDKEDESS